MRNPDPAVMPVAATTCDRCLLGKRPLVTNERRDQILEQCKTSGRAFICHRASMAGEYVVCRSFYERQLSLSAILGNKLGLARFVPLPSGAARTADEEAT